MHLRPPTAPMDGAPLSKPNAVHNDAAAWRAAKDFESLFLSQMMGSMFSGLDSKGMFNGGHGEAIYRSMMGEEFGRLASKSGGLGIAPAVYREIVKLQEVQSP
ncbi:MAG: rod-binding protein [Alphaproteobacteria bacterium]